MIDVVENQKYYMDVMTDTRYETYDREVWKSWIDENAIGTAKIVNMGAPKLSLVGTPSQINYRIYFENERDATIFRLYFE